MPSPRNLLEDILAMKEGELVDYVAEQSEKKAILFDPDFFEGEGIQALLDFIADNIHPELWSQLHSESEIGPGCNMFPAAKTEKDIDDEMEHFD